MYLIAVCAIISWQECFAVLLLVPLWLKTCFCSQVVFDIYQQELTRQTLMLLNGWVFIHMQILEREHIWWTQKSSELQSLKSQKSIYKQHNITTSGSWWYTEVLWSETICHCKKISFIYNVITCNPEPRANSPEWSPVNEQIIILNQLFLVNQFDCSLNWGTVDWSVRNSSRLKQHRSTSFSIKTYFQTCLTVTLTWNYSKYSIYDPMMLFFAHSTLQFLQQSLNWGTQNKDQWVFMVSNGLCKELSWWKTSLFSLFVTLDHKTSLKLLGYICSNSQKYIEWVKIIHFSFMPKIIRILSKDHVSHHYWVL